MNILLISLRNRIKLKGKSGILVSVFKAISGMEIPFY